MKTTAVYTMNCGFADQGILRIDKIAAGVGIVLFSVSHRIAAGIHVLRGIADTEKPGNPAYYADTGIAYILDEFKKRGVNPPLSIAIAGGARMLSKGDAEGKESALVRSVKSVLTQNRLNPKIVKIGGSSIRSIVLDIDHGKIKIS